VVECGQVGLAKEIAMPKPQPSFTAEFKHEVVQLTKTSDKPKAQIARELGISDSACMPGAERKKPMARKPFLAKVISYRWNKKFIVSSANESGLNRSVTSLAK
jgi:hypothetical protein